MSDATEPVSCEPYTISERVLLDELAAHERCPHGCDVILWVPDPDDEVWGFRNEHDTESCPIGRDILARWEAGQRRSQLRLIRGGEA